MARCEHLRDTYLVTDPVTKSRRLHFKRPLTPPFGIPQKTPCGRCLNCKLNAADEKATRMMMESRFHNSSAFVTLTYNDDNLPDDWSINKREHQLFLKKLRHSVPNKIRYVLCGEYGERTSRPHYHAIIFGLHLEDKTVYDRNERGEPYYSSEKLDSIWGKGNTIIGDVTYNTCAYVAGYLLKDTKIKTGTDHEGKPFPYELLHPETGELTAREKPYVVYSNRPGIGSKFFEEFGSDMFPHDKLVYPKKGKIIEQRPPKYFDKLLERKDPELHEKIKEQRKAALLTPQALSNAHPERLAASLVIRDQNLANAQRGKSKGAYQEKIAVKQWKQ